MNLCMKIGIQYANLTIQSDANVKGLSILGEIYVERSHALWKDSQSMSFLKEGMSSCSRLSVNSEKYKETIERGAEIRSDYYNDIPLNVLRHVFLSEYDIKGYVPSSFPSQFLVWSIHFE